MCNELKQLEKFCSDTLKKIEAQKSIEATLAGTDDLYIKLKELRTISLISEDLERLDYINKQN